MTQETYLSFYLAVLHPLLAIIYAKLGINRFIIPFKVFLSNHLIYLHLTLTHSHKSRARLANMQKFTPKANNGILFIPHFLKRFVHRIPPFHHQLFNASLTASTTNQFFFPIIKNYPDLFMKPSPIPPLPMALFQLFLFSSPSFPNLPLTSPLILYQ